MKVVPPSEDATRATDVPWPIQETDCTGATTKAPIVEPVLEAVAANTGKKLSNKTINLIYLLY